MNLNVLGPGGFKGGSTDLSQLRNFFATITLQRYVASGGTLVFSAACQFGWFIILARSFGIEEFGRLIMIIAVTNFAMALCGVGAADTIARRTARSKSDYGAMLGHALIVIVISGVILSLISTVILSFVVKAVPNAWMNVLVMASFSVTNVILFRWMTFAENLFIGFFRFAEANFINAGFSALRLASAALACLVFNVHSLGHWCIWTLLTYLVAGAICLAMIRPLGRPVWRVDRKELVLGFHFSTPIVVDALRQNVDRFVLGISAPIAVLGSYGTAYRMAEVSQIVVTALNRIVYPRFAQRKADGFNRILPTARTYLIAVLALATVTAACVHIIAPYITELLGPSYRPVTGDLRVLCWLIVPMAVRTVPYDVFGAFDRHEIRAAVYNTIFLVCSILTAAAVYWFGVTGAMVSAFAVQILVGIGLWSALVRAARRERAMNG